jgi:ferric iron reductase protein FhuF
MSISLHWIFAWYSYVQEQNEHERPIHFNDYFNETFRDTMENWQSEFLQLMWQVAGLSILWYIGSSQSKEGDDRLEEKIDLLIQRLDSEKGKQIIQELDKKYPRKQ